MLLENLFGIATWQQAGGWCYTLKDDQEGQIALYLNNDDVQSVNLGVALQRGVLAWSGDDPTTWTFDGVGRSQHDFTPFALANDVLKHVGVGNVVTVGSANAAVVTAVSATGLTTGGNELTTGAVADGLPTPKPDKSLPHIATAGSLFYADGGTAEAATIAAATKIMHTSGSIDFNNGVGLITGEVGTSEPTGVGSPGVRNTPITLTTRVRPSDYQLSNDIRNNPSKFFSLVVELSGLEGHVRAAAKTRVYMPNVQFNPGVVRRSLGAYDTMTLSGIAVGVGGVDSIRVTML